MRTFLVMVIFSSVAVGCFQTVNDGDAGEDDGRDSGVRDSAAIQDANECWDVIGSGFNCFPCCVNKKILNGCTVQDEAVQLRCPQDYECFGGRCEPIGAYDASQSDGFSIPDRSIDRR